MATCSLESVLVELVQLYFFIHSSPYFLKPATVLHIFGPCSPLGLKAFSMIIGFFGRYACFECSCDESFSFYQSKNFNGNILIQDHVI